VTAVKEDAGVHEEVCDGGEGRRWCPRGGV